MSDFPSRIVCVEDDEDIRDLVRGSLALSGEEFILVGCSSGEEIIDRIRELQPDLLILDLLLGDMTGPDVLEALRPYLNKSRVKILFLNGHLKVVMTDHYRKLGVVGVVYKPFEPEALVEAVRSAWGTQAG
jgi:DNA-binding response OmpR family regulator